MANYVLPQTGAEVQSDLNFLESLATPFSTSQTYSVGNIVRYGEALYKCTTAVTTAGAWDSSKWQAIDLSNLGGSGGSSSTVTCYTSNPATDPQIPNGQLAFCVTATEPSTKYNNIMYIVTGT